MGLGQIERIFAMTPVVVEQELQVAFGHHQAGRLAEAEKIYRGILAAQPNHAETLHRLGVLAAQVGQSELAIDLFTRSVRINPDNPDAHFNLGVVLRKTNRFEQAVSELRQTARKRAHIPAVHIELGRALYGMQKYEEAISAFATASALNPGSPDIYSNLGNALRAAGRMDEAETAHRQAIEADPKYAPAYTNLGIVLMEQGRLDEAVAACKKAVELSPDIPETYYNLGTALHDSGRFDEAIKVYEHSIRLAPNSWQSHWNLALALLTIGDYPRGWKEFQWRLDAHFPERQLFRPRWNGESLEGKTILLRSDPGSFGDMLQFARYAKKVAERGGRVVLECLPELKRLLTNTPGVDRTFVAEQTPPHFDVQCMLMELPLIFGTDLNSIPNAVPYVIPDLQSVRSWGEKLGEKKKLRVGLAWAGASRSMYKGTRGRSMGLAQLQPLANLPGVEFHNLQMGDAASEISPYTLPLIDHTKEIADFADTAALVANLDLVITVDTAIAHLVGAMGKPVWVMLPFVGDWRYLRDRFDSPWYPTMRLFRTKTVGNWNPLVEEVSDELRKLAAIPPPHSRD
jgi:tetratricopeptide (TPR) repeat protein